MSISVVSAEQLEALQGMFPGETPEGLRRALREHKGDLDATIEALLTGATAAPPKNKGDGAVDDKKPSTNGWTCQTCTFENKLGCRRCAMCDGPGPNTTTPAPITPPKGGEGTDDAMVVPPWWNTFWRDHRATLNCDERAAKEILFAGGRFKNSQILTVDVKSKIYRLLGAEEVHHVAPPDNDHGDDYDGFNHGFFPPPAFPRPPRYRPLGGGLHPLYPAPSSSGLPYPPYPSSPHHRAMG